MTIQTAFRLKKTLVDKLKKYCEKEGRSQTWVANKAFSDYLGLTQKAPTRIVSDKKPVASKAVAVVGDDLFDVFWKEYPKNQSKAPALKAWTKLNPDQQLFDLIVSKVIEFKSSNEWKKDGGQFIPMASTWLNNKRWEDSMTYGGQTNGQNKPRQHIKQTPLERMEEQMRIDELQPAPSTDNGKVLGADDSIVSTQMGEYRG